MPSNVILQSMRFCRGGCCYRRHCRCRRRCRRLGVGARAFRASGREGATSERETRALARAAALVWILGDFAVLASCSPTQGNRPSCSSGPGSPALQRRGSVGTDWVWGAGIAACSVTWTCTPRMYPCTCVCVSRETRQMNCWPSSCRCHCYCIACTAGRRTPQTQPALSSSSGAFPWPACARGKAPSKRKDLRASERATPYLPTWMNGGAAATATHNKASKVGGCIDEISNAHVKLGHGTRVSRAK